MRINSLYIHMGANEYGNDLMKKVADEQAAIHAWPLLITVHEHAGWFLQYYYAEKNVGIIVGTANDAAAVSHRQIREDIEKAVIVNLPDIRRP